MFVEVEKVCPHVGEGNCYQAGSRGRLEIKRILEWVVESVCVMGEAAPADRLMLGSALIRATYPATVTQMPEQDARPLQLA